MHEYGKKGMVKPVKVKKFIKLNALINSKNLALTKNPSNLPLQCGK
jgi:hypothetical protein